MVQVAVMKLKDDLKHQACKSFSYDTIKGSTFASSSRLPATSAGNFMSLLQAGSHKTLLKTIILYPFIAVKHATFTVFEHDVYKLMSIGCIVVVFVSALRPLAHPLILIEKKTS